MRRYEIGTRLAIGAKQRDLIFLVLKENGKAVISGILGSGILLGFIYYLFEKSIIEYLTLPILPLLIFSLGMISLLSFCSCYLPLRKYLKQPAIYALRGN
jgi:ABC-type antimicrobial peptide transport system permease subunit